MDFEARRNHWDERYRTVGADQVSWFAPEPTLSLALIDELGLDPTTSIIDVGGGASLLADRLVARGARDLTVLDVSAQALQVVADRVGSDAATWLTADLLRWFPQRRYGLWHDRAVFHFLTDPADRRSYVTALRHGIEPGGVVVIATFAPDGPEMCSGLPTARYDAEGIGAVLGSDFELMIDRREAHHTPGGATQQFAWAAFRAPVDLPGTTRDS